MGKLNVFVLFGLWVLCVTSGVHVQSISDYLENLQSLILNSINEPAAPSFERCNEDLLQKATFGDMIEIKRSDYFHWCVFIRGETVIQLNNPEFDRLNVFNANNNFIGHVELCNLIKLAKNDLCRINNKISESKRRHLLALSKSDTWALMENELNHNVTSYNVIDYNCEHFATKLKFRVPFSSQIEALKKIVPIDDIKETVAKMFEIAGSLNFTEYASENYPDLMSLVEQIKF